MNDDDFYDKLEQLLNERHADDVLYVYATGPDGRVRKPYLLRAEPWPELLLHLQARYGGGCFRIMIRRGRKMLLTGSVRIARLPLQRASRAFSDV